MMDLFNGNIKKYNKIKIFLFLLSIFSIINVVIISTVHHDFIRKDCDCSTSYSLDNHNNEVPAKRHDHRHCLKCQLVDNVIRVSYLLFSYDNIEDSSFFEEEKPSFKVSHDFIEQKNSRAPPLS